jgi:hypothetical protein
MEMKIGKGDKIIADRRGRQHASLRQGEAAVRGGALIRRGASPREARGRSACSSSGGTGARRAIVLELDQYVAPGSAVTVVADSDDGGGRRSKRSAIS